MCILFLNFLRIALIVSVNLWETECSRISLFVIPFFVACLHGRGVDLLGGGVRRCTPLITFGVRKSCQFSYEIHVLDLERNFQKHGYNINRDKMR
jgi:hypothetical protein